MANTLMSGVIKISTLGGAGTLSTIQAIKLAMVGLAGVVGYQLGQAIKDANKQLEINGMMLQSVANSYGMTTDEAQGLTKQYLALSSELAYHSKFYDEEIAQSIQMSTLMGRQAGEIEQVTQTIIDLSTAYNMDLRSATRYVNLAIDGQTSMLRRYGIIIEDTDHALEELSGKLEGMGQAALDAGANKMQLLKKAFIDIREGIGMGILQSETFTTAIEVMSETAAANGVTVAENTGNMTQKIMNFFGDLMNIVSSSLNLLWHSVEMIVKAAMNGITVMVTAVVDTIIVLSKKPAEAFTLMWYQSMKQILGAVRWLDGILGKAGVDLYANLGITAEEVEQQFHLLDKKIIEVGESLGNTYSSTANAAGHLVDELIRDTESIEDSINAIRLSWNDIFNQGEVSTEIEVIIPPPTNTNITDAERTGSSLAEVMGEAFNNSIQSTITSALDQVTHLAKKIKTSIQGGEESEGGIDWLSTGENIGTTLLGGITQAFRADAKNQGQIMANMLFSIIKMFMSNMNVPGAGILGGLLGVFMGGASAGGGGGMRTRMQYRQARIGTVRL